MSDVKSFSDAASVQGTKNAEAGGFCYNSTEVLKRWLMIMLDEKIHIRKNVLWKIIDGEIILLNLKNSEYFSVNDTGSKILELNGKDRQRTVAEISSLLAKELQISIETARRDTQKFLNTLLKYQLIEAD